MLKLSAFLAIITCLLSVGGVIYFSKDPVFICETPFTMTQNVNNEVIRAQGVMFVHVDGDKLFIKMDGLLTHQSKKYIIARTIELAYKHYNLKADLYKVVSLDTVRDDTDNIDDGLVSGLLFGMRQKEKIIFLKRVGDSVILFGNNTFPQFGCLRNPAEAHS